MRRSDVEDAAFVMVSVLDGVCNLLQHRHDYLVKIYNRNAVTLQLNQ